MTTLRAVLYAITIGIAVGAWVTIVGKWAGWWG